MYHLAFLLLAGCAAEPYIEIGLSAPIESQTDYWIHPDRDWQCQPPWFDGEVGLETKHNLAVGIYHYSTVRCGTINEKPEIYWNGVRVSKKWGGYD